MSEDIAIIGMAGRFPGANDLQEFHQNLRAGRDCVTEISRQRFCDTNFPLGKDRYQVMGLLDQIDRFDRKFFNISPREAQQIDPHQRITLELAYHALEDSGYSPASFAGANTAVIVANADYTYLRNFEILEPTMYSGNSQFSIAGRIARFFNLKGPAFITDTGCSSGLMSVTLACDQLTLGKCSTALVIGVRVVLEPLPVDLDVDVGITSADGKTRSFNADSNGSGSSEAAVAVLLKPLRQALTDNDHIYAVIKSTAVNSSAQSSASLTATSSAAQAEMLVEAWKRAGIDPTTVDYIEAHGSGTQLGDPIEIGGLDLAFRKFTQRKKICAVSSVKSNIGHTDKVAGLSGLAKAVLSVQHAEHFASLHFNRPNPLIDFENSAAFINTTHRPWIPQPGTPRRAGVNSFGFAGNNVHVVLEEAPARASLPPAAPGALHLVTLSSKRAGGLAAQRAALRAYLEQNRTVSLADVSFTLNTGREHFRHRDAFLARDADDLIAQLQAAPAVDDDTVAPPAQVAPVFVFSGDASVDPAETERLAAAFPEFRQAYTGCLAAAAGHSGAASVQRFAFQYACYRLLAALGVGTEDLVGTGVGDLVVRTLTGELRLADALRESLALPAIDATADLSARLSTLVDQSTETMPALFVEMGLDGALSRGLRELNTPAQRELYDVLTLDRSAADHMLALLRKFHLAGGTVDWTATHRHYLGRRLSLPGYSFEKIRCWYREPHAIADYEAWRERIAAGATGAGPAPGSLTAGPVPTAELPLDNTWTQTERQIARIWMDVLKIDRVALDDDFFALGGHSLFGTMVRNRVDQAFRLRLEFRDIFVHNKIRSLAESIDRRLAQGAPRFVEDALPVVAPAEHYASSPAQRLIWTLEQREGTMHSAYNVPVVFAFNGDLDIERLERALRELVARHEVLRTHFIAVDGEPRQVISPAGDFRLERLAALSADDVPVLLERFIRPFDLAQPPLVRGALIRTGKSTHVLAVDIHHTLFDGSSLGVLLRELAALYKGETLPALRHSYKDYAAWRLASLAQPQMRESEAFWLGEFAGELPVLTLPTDFPRPAARSFEGAVTTVVYDQTFSTRVRTLAQRESSTLFMVLLAGYSVLLSKLAGQEDVIIGSSVAGRTHSELEPLMGMFVNTLAFRTAPQEALTFRQFLAEVREKCLQVYKHQAYPLDSLLRQLGIAENPARHPLFDTLLVLQNMDLGSESFAEGLQLSPVEFPRTSSKYDLTFEFYDAPEGLVLNVEYARALFQPKTIAAMTSSLKRILDAACDDAGVSLGAIDCLDASTA